MRERLSALQLLPAPPAPFGAVLGNRIRRDRALAIGYGAQALAMTTTGVALWSDLHAWVVDERRWTHDD